MEISKAEALDLLRKWQSEKQLLTYSADGPAPADEVVSGIGRIETLTDEMLHIGADAVFPAMPADIFWVKIPLSDVDTRFEYTEVHELSDEELKKIGEPMLDHSLFISLYSRCLRFCISAFVEGIRL